MIASGRADHTLGVIHVKSTVDNTDFYISAFPAKEANSGLVERVPWI